MSKVLDALAFAQSLARRPALRTARNEHGHAVVPPEVPALEWKATSRLAGLSLVPGRWWVVSRGTEKLPVLAVVREFELRLVGSDEPARTYTVEWPLDRSKPEGLAFASAMTLSTRYLEVELLQLPIAMGPDEGGSAAPSGETPAAQDFELEQLGLSPRTLATLKNHRIWSALDLCRFTRRELLRLEGVGPGALLEVSQALQAKGLALDVEPAPDLSKEFGDLPDIHQNNATTAPGEASSPGEKGDSSTGQASRPVEDLPAKGSVVAPSKDPMLAVVEAAPESPDGVKKIPARAFIQVQSEGEATPQPPAPQVDGRSPDLPASPSAWPSIPECDCCPGYATCRNSEKPHPLQAIQDAIGGPDAAAKVADHLERERAMDKADDQGLLCRYCDTIAKSPAGKASHERKCKARPPETQEAAPKQRDPRKDPQAGDAPKYLGITYRVVRIEGKAIALALESYPSGVLVRDEKVWSFAQWRAFWKKRTPDPANVSLVKESGNVVSEGLSAVGQWKEESS